jgi:hypothetical protein
MNRGFISIPAYVESVYFDKNRPENNNVYMPNRRDRNKVIIFNGVKWILTDKNEIINDLKDKGIDFIHRNYKELDPDNKTDKIIIKKIDKFLKNYNCDDNEDKNKIKINKLLDENIELVLYNNKEITEKTRF